MISSRSIHLSGHFVTDGEDSDEDYSVMHPSEKNVLETNSLFRFPLPSLVHGINSCFVGIGGKIPLNSWLVFDVGLFDVRRVLMK